MICTLSKRQIISATCELSSANALNLDQSRILSFGRELRKGPCDLITHFRNLYMRGSSDFCLKFDDRAKYPNFDRFRVNFYHMRYGLYMT